MDSLKVALLKDLDLTYLTPLPVWAIVTKHWVQTMGIRPNCNATHS